MWHQSLPVSTICLYSVAQIDGVNVVQASHEQTVQIIKKAGDVLAMKVVRAVLTQANGGNHLVNGAMNGSTTLPHRKPQRDEGKLKVKVAEKTRLRLLKMLDKVSLFFY